MPKYDSLEKYWYAKWEGQAEQCEVQRKEIRGLKVSRESWRSSFMLKQMQWSQSRNEIGDLRRKVKELQNIIDDMEVYE